MGNLRVRVQPNSRRPGIVGWVGNALRVRVTAPPIEGRANRAVVDLLAAKLGIPPSRIEILAGASGRDKHIEIVGLDTAEITRRLSPADCGDGKNQNAVP